MTHAPVLIRPARRGDLGAIVGLFADDELAVAGRSVAPHPTEAHPTLLPPRQGTLTQAHVDAFDAIEAEPNNRVYVAELEGEVVGTFQLTFIRQLSYGGSLVAQVESVHVHSGVRSRGVGVTMMNFAKAEARQRGALRLQLTSNVKRSRAHQFYERLGFSATHKGMKLYLE